MHDIGEVKRKGLGQSVPCCCWRTVAMSLAPSPATGLLGTIVMWTETTCALTRLHIVNVHQKRPYKPCM